jgi:NitT/TauT family transport system substrate-binding protein
MRQVPARVRPTLCARRAPAASAAVAAAALALAGCHVPGSSSASGLPQGSSVTVAAVPGVGDAPLFIAQRDGLFAKAGLTVHIRRYSSVAAVMSALRSGQATVGAGDYADVFYTQARCKGCLSLVASGYAAGPRMMEILSRPNSGITTPQQLVGKTIGTAAAQVIPVRKSPGTATTTQPFSMETIAAASALQDNGVQPSDVRWQPMPASNLVNALRTHLVDAVLATEPQIFQAESRLGALGILDVASGETVGLPLDGYFADTSFAARHRQALQAFRSALAQAQENAVRAAPVQATLEHFGGWTKQTAALVAIGAYPTSLSPADLQRVTTLMSFYGVLSTPIDISKMILH